MAFKVLCSGQPWQAELSTRPKEPKRAEDHAGTPAKDGRTPTASSQRQRPFLNLDSRKCYECGERGHIAWNCPNHDVPMPLASASEVATGRPWGLRMECWAEESGPSPVTPVRANGKDTTALSDTESMVTLIRPDFAKSPNLTDTVAIMCIHGETQDYPATLLHLQTTKRQHTGPVGVVPYLPVLVLLGRDFTMFCQLWTSMSGDMGNQKGGGSRRGGRDARRSDSRKWPPGVNRTPL